MSDQTSKGVNNVNESADSSTKKMTNTNGLKRLLIVVIVVSLLGALFAFGLLTERSDRSDIGSPLVGKELPNFTVPLFARYQDEYGETFTFPVQEDKPMVINFWASWCTPCLTEAPELEAASQEFADEVLFVGINTQDRDERRIQAFLDQVGLTFPNGHDKNGRLSIEYGIFGMPETFFINADGTLNYKHSGALTFEVLAEQTQALIR